MKTRTLILGAAAGLDLLAGTTIYGQIPIETRTTVTSTGTVSEFTPNAIAVKTTMSPVPIHYTFTKTTTYVDENGNPVSVETVRTGAPVTVYYEKSGDSFVADKVVVKKSVSTTTTDVAAPVTIAPTAPPPSTDAIFAGRGIDEIAVTTPAGRMHYDTGTARRMSMRTGIRLREAR